MDLDEAKRIVLQDGETKNEYKTIKWRYRIARMMSQRRRELHISQRDLAQKCGLKQPQIARIEQGENVSLDMLEKVATSLDLEFDLVSIDSSRI